MTWFDIAMTIGGCLFAVAIRSRGWWALLTTAREEIAKLEEQVERVKRNADSHRQTAGHYQEKYRQALGLTGGRTKSATWQTELDQRIREALRDAGTGSGPYRR